jgi:glycosyltransferase involved in cell wall biosynthesis/2-polyprenyl-3-methyl-5-hydroxy-6-metoxy-1,4-benzoquinol methylase
MQKKAFYIPFEYFRSIGGPSTFMQNLKTYLDNQEFKYQDIPKGVVSIFFPVSFDLSILSEIKNRKGKIIQRLDGIYYPSKHQDKYIEFNRVIKEIYTNYADFVIFQSEYSKKQCFTMFGEKLSAQYALIVNGVNKKIFYPIFEKKELSQKLKVVTTGNFRNLDMLEPVIKALDTLENKLDFELTVVGPIVNPSLETLLKREYVNYVGSKNLEEVAGILRNADIFIYSHLNPPCPNSVLEAISCGLPVVGFDSGSMAELLYFSKELLASVSDEIFQRYEDFDYRKLAKKILLVVENYQEYRQRALENSSLYSFEECGRRYIEIFEQLNPKSKLFSRCKKLVKKIIKRMRNILNLNFANFEPENSQKNMSIDSNYVLNLIREKVNSLPPEDSLRFLFDVENKLYQLEGQEAIRYGNGIHTKHKHIQYHDFFVKNISVGTKVLDVGCGNGALACDVADRVSKVTVFGIDIVDANIDTARKRFSRDNIRYVCGDALKDLPDEEFDIIMLSNVLEHIENRVDFLITLQSRYRPRKFLLRVPIFERDWRVPLKKELGMDYRLDKTHYIEYWQEEFFNEITQANLKITHHEVKWGEIWAEAVAV